MHGDKQKPDNPVFGQLDGDTLTNCCQIIELLEYLDLSEGISKDAEFGFYLIMETVISHLKYISNELKVP